MGEIDIYKKAAQADPTHTISLRNMFVRAMTRRFTELSKVVKVSIDLNDCFGLKSKLLSQQMNPVAKKAFEFSTSTEKVEAFMQWLQKQVDAGLLDVGVARQLGTAMNESWLNLYVLDSYKRGIIRARQELNSAGIQVPNLDSQEAINLALSTAFHMDRIGLLYTRVYSELKGITEAMDTAISRILAQGMIDGDGAALLARKITEAINTIGINRATILARTEIIRAHHIATIQEYRNWGLEGVIVLAEWSTAGDDRVCPICEGLEGKIFTLDEIEGAIPRHPQCFIDSQIPIYTSKGWKPIGKIKIGDKVLTHKRRFRKVYALPRSKSIANKTKVVTFKFKGDSHLTITANHPILITREGNKYSRWKAAGNCTTEDMVVMLGNECKRCKKPIPYFHKYCSRTCLSLDITDKQWMNLDHRKNMSKKTSIQLNREYANGVRNGKKITKAANKKTREMVKKGIHPFQLPEVQAKMIIATHTPELNKRHSNRMKRKIL